MATSEIVSKVRGVAKFQRQTRLCRRGAELRVVRESKNKWDTHAIRLDVQGGVVFRSWRPVGYLSEDLADRFAPFVDRGLRLRVLVSEVTGGRRGKRFRGVNIVIQYDPEHRKRIEREIQQEFHRQKARTVRDTLVAAEARQKPPRRPKPPKPARAPRVRKPSLTGKAIKSVGRGCRWFALGVVDELREWSDQRSRPGS